MSLAFRIIAFAIVLALAPLICSCGGESDSPDPSELEEMSEELNQRLVQADLKPVEEFDEEFEEADVGE